MQPEYLKIPKQLTEVTLWIHPDGRVVGSLFLSYQGEGDTLRSEEPAEVLNQPARFLVLQREDKNDIRFYNKASIVRVEYSSGDDAAVEMGVDPIPCVLHLMDGSMIRGNIQRVLPPDQSRLYDYLNLEDEAFIKIHIGEGRVCVVNKSYVVRVSPVNAG